MSKKLQVKSCLSLVAVLIVSIAAQAQNWPGPKVNGNTAITSSVFGAASSATQTTAAYNPVDGPGILFGFHVSTQVASWRIVIRDSAAAQAGAGVPLDVVTVPEIGQSSGSWNAIIRLDPPLRFYNGLSLNASACPNSGNTLGDHCFTALFDSANQ